MKARQQRIFDFLNTHRAGVIASVDPNGEPHAAVIYHMIDETDLNIYFLTKTETKKYDNLIRHNHAVLIVFDTATQTVAKVVGKVSEVKDPDQINKIAQSVSDASLANNPFSIIPIAKLDAGDYVGFRITPDQIRIATYAKPQQGDYYTLFETEESFELEPGY